MTTEEVGPNVNDDTCAWWEATVTSGTHCFILNKADSLKEKNELQLQKVFPNT